MKTLGPNTLLQNRYLVVQLIGKGGMGEVYLAVDQRLGSAVALKRTFFSDDEMLGNAFEREAKTLARLRHPVLPKVSDHFTENETQYLAMEHISGDDLSKRLEITDKPFPLSWVLFWADQLLDALAYLHAHEPPIVHRDIKPQNLKLTDDNHIVLLDFGLAKNSIGNTKVNSTSSGSIVGYTPHYAPMEQIRGTGTNPRSDLYSLSATVYQLLTNIVPPDALTRADSVLNGLPDPTKPLNVLNPEIPKAISDVILKGMSLSMDQRYDNARDMQKALREAYAGMQDSMSANTVAFNTSDVKETTPTPQAPPTADFPAAAKITDQPNTYQPKTENLPSSTGQNYSAPTDFDATMRDSGGQNFGLKTEIMPRDKMPRAEDYGTSSGSSFDPPTNNYSSTHNHETPTNNYSSTPPPVEDFRKDDFSFAPEDDFSSEPKVKEFDPGATIPLIHFDKENDAPVTSDRFDSRSEPEKTFVPSVTPAQPHNFAAETSAPRQENFAAPPVKTEATKKSGGKGLAIAAGVGVFFIVIIAAAAGGWYLMKSSGTTAATPTPTPIVESTPTPIISPTIEPTVEPTVEANTNTGISNSSDVVTSEPANTNDAANKKAEVTPTPDVRTQIDRPAQITPQRTPPPRQNSSTTAGTHLTPPPAVKTPAPQKTPAKSGRTDILQ